MPMIGKQPLDLFISLNHSEPLAKKKRLESPVDFRKKQIELGFVDVDSQFRQLSEAQNLQQVRRYIPNIRNQLFQIYNICIHVLDVNKFANHQPGDKTPLNSGCC